jgi:hypothetical protein
MQQHQWQRPGTQDAGPDATRAPKDQEQKKVQAANQARESQDRDDPRRDQETPHSGAEKERVQPSPDDLDDSTGNG